MRFVADQIRSRGHRALLIDVGTGAPPTIFPDVTREAIAMSTNLDLAMLSQQAGPRCVCLSHVNARAAFCA